jgi:hypothetical protein
MNERKKRDDSTRHSVSMKRGKNNVILLIAPEGSLIIIAVIKESIVRIRALNRGDFFSFLKVSNIVERCQISNNSNERRRIT